MAEHLELLTTRFCPYGVRCLALLAAGRLAHEPVELPDELPDWVKQLSPAGVVPLLRVDDTVLHETAAICEYVAERSEVQLLPADPIARAVARGWAAHAATMNPLSMRMLAAATEDELRAATAKLEAGLLSLERHIEARRLPVDIPFTDAAYVAFFGRLRAAEKVKETPMMRGVERCRRWSDAILARFEAAVPLVHDHGAAFVEFFVRKQTAFFAG